MIAPTVSQPTHELFDQSRTLIFRTGLAVHLILFAAVAFFIRPSSEALIVRYNAFFGVDILGVWWQAYLVPGMCLVFFLGNLGLAKVLARRQSFLPALVLSFGALLITLAGAIATAALIFINT